MNHSKVPRSLRMTPRADRKVIASEGAFPIVTCRATHRSSPRMVIESRRRSDLPALGDSRPDGMTTITIEFLPRAMLRMTESHSECRRLHWRSYMSPGLMARTAGRNVAAFCHDSRTVALIAGGVRAETRWNRQGYAAATGSMTSCTPDSEPARMH